MAGNGRNQRRGLLEVLEFARAGEKGITNIESKKNIVGAINFGIEERVRKEIRMRMKRSGEEYIELISGDYFVYDVTAEMPSVFCRIDECKRRARVLESRLIFAYDEKDQEYQLGEFSSEVRNILQSTRKRAAICDDDMMEAQIRGDTLDIFQRIPQIGELAIVRKIKGGHPVVGANLLKPAFGRNQRSANKTSKGADVIDLFDKDKQ